MWNAGKEGYSKGKMHERREGCRTGGMEDRKYAVQEGFRTDGKQDR